VASQKVEDYPIVEEAFTLRDTLVRLLETTVDVFAAAGVPLPTRQYWTMQEPSEDCSQVTVYFLQMYLGLPGDSANTPQRCTGPRSAVINIDITRDFPIGVNGSAIAPQKIMDAAAMAAVDVQVLMDALKQFDTPYEGGFGPGVIATVQAQEPQGGLQTTRLNLTIAVL
jgi:hypothetical protein